MIVRMKLVLRGSEKPDKPPLWIYLFAVKHSPWLVCVTGVGSPLQVDHVYLPTFHSNLRAKPFPFSLRSYDSEIIFYHEISIFISNNSCYIFLRNFIVKKAGIPRISLCNMKYYNFSFQFIVHYFILFRMLLNIKRNSRRSRF